MFWRWSAGGSKRGGRRNVEGVGRAPSFALLDVLEVSTKGRFARDLDDGTGLALLLLVHVTALQLKVCLVVVACAEGGGEV